MLEGVGEVNWIEYKGSQACQYITRGATQILMT